MKNKDFVIYIRKLRIRAGLSQTQVADALKLRSGQLVSNWERGECYPPVLAFPELSRLYKVPLDSLIRQYMKAVKTDLMDRLKTLPEVPK